MRPAFILVLAATLFGCDVSTSDPVDSARAVNVGNGEYRLEWEGTNAPVDVFVANEANAASDKMRMVVEKDRDGRASVQVNQTARPYFFIASEGGGIWAAERVLPLEGATNFRDLGGYATQDGQRVKWGKLYRSGNMSGLTPSDYDYLSGLGIKIVCDLRTNEERASMPNKWVAANDVSYWSRDYAMSDGELGRLLTNGATPARIKAAMTESYGRLPYEQAPAYREIFDRLASGDIPLAFNCTGGKDRAGVGAALILDALGVPRETIVADYAMSDKVIDPVKARSSMPREHGFDQWPAELLAPLSASDPDYLRAAFAAIERRSGSVRQFLKTEVGVTDAKIATIRKALLE